MQLSWPPRVQLAAPHRGRLGLGVGASVSTKGRRYGGSGHWVSVAEASGLVRKRPAGLATNPPSTPARDGKASSPSEPHRFSA
jgi:hypothetical protein